MGAGGGWSERRQGLELTLHRCFDLVPDMGEALEAAVALGFQRILTSGGARRRPKRVGAVAGDVLRRRRGGSR